MVDDRVLLSPPDVGPSERQAILRAFDSGWIAPVGEELDCFEDELADYVGGPAVVALSSGSAALRIGLEILGVKAGDEVVVPSATFAASAFSVVHAGARPVFCDSERSSWCIDPELLTGFLERRAAEGRLPAAVMPVSLYGSAPDYVSLRNACDRFDIPLIEDAAEALGTVSSTGRVGSLSHPTIFSFNGNKLITTSSGGAFVGTFEQAKRARHLATQAREPFIYYEHEDIGFNFRLSNLLAALGRAQLARVEELIERRTQINATYVAELGELDWCPYEFTVRPNHWLSVGILPDGFSSIEVCESLNNAGIDARPAWKPMHLQPVFRDAEMIGSGKVSEGLFTQGICLPSGSALTDEQIARVISALKSHMAR